MTHVYELFAIYSTLNAGLWQNAQFANCQFKLSNLFKASSVCRFVHDNLFCDIFYRVQQLDQYVIVLVIS